MKYYESRYGPFGKYMNVLHIEEAEPFTIYYSDVCQHGTEYIFSIYVQEFTGAKPTLTFMDQTETIENLGWNFLVFKFTATGSDLELSVPAGKYYMACAQLKEGNTLSTWYPAREDFMTQEDRSVIDQRADQIRLEVSKKVGHDEVISSINQTAEAVTIDASKINLNGAVSANGYFKIGTDGKVAIDGGKIDIKGISQAFPTETIIDGSGFVTTQNWGQVLDTRGGIDSSIIIYKALNDGEFTPDNSQPKMWLANNALSIGRSVSGGGNDTNGGTKLEEGTITVFGKEKTSDGFYKQIVINPKTEYGLFVYDTKAFFGTDILVGGKTETKSLFVTGSDKTRVVTTENFGQVRQYAFETPTPTFADYGQGQIDESGRCRIFLDEKFIETLDGITPCNVFLTKYGRGDLYVVDRTLDYFDVEGTPGIDFSWMSMGTQADGNTKRLDPHTEELEFETTDLEDIGFEFITEYEGSLEE